MPDRMHGDSTGRVQGDAGFALMLTALLIIPLMVFTAFAVDVGAWYAQASRTQRVADAAALAGVVWLPDTTAAINASNQSLAKNWTLPGSAPTCTSTTCKIVNGVQWEVDVSAAAPIYFSNVVGRVINNISREAVAAINPPVPLGSPLPSFGNNLPSGCTNPFNCPTDPNGNPQPNVWASINGPYRSHQDGDPFTTRCWGDSASISACTNPPTFNNAKNYTSGHTSDPVPTNPAPPNSDPQWNPYYHPDGYLFAVNVLTPGNVTVQIWDASCNGSGTNPAGDQGCLDGSGNSAATPIEFQMYNFSGNALQINTSPTNTISGCNMKAPTNSGTYNNQWVSLCTFSAPKAGIYPLRVRVDDIPGVCPYTNQWTSDGCNGSEINSFSVRATNTAGVAQSQVYAIDYMSIWNNIQGTGASFWLANIEKVNAGKTMILDMYDPGDANDPDTNPGHTMQLRLRGPSQTNGGGQSSPVSDFNYDLPCDWARSDSQGGVSNLSQSSAGVCTIVSHNTATQPFSRFNNQWIRVVVKLPSNYTCPVNQNKCWWKVFYDFTSVTPSDRTVWALNIIGDPVHLTQ